MSVLIWVVLLQQRLKKVVLVDFGFSFDVWPLVPLLQRMRI